VHYAWARDIVGVPLYYRKGTPYSNGSISWSAAEQIAVPVQSGIARSEPFVSTDSNGYPWIGYRWRNGTTYYPFVTKSSLNNGTWSTASGFPYKLKDTSGPWWTVSPIPLTYSKVYLIYGYSGATIKGRLWNGATWGNEEEISSSTLAYSDWYSAVSKNNDLHLVFLKHITYDIIYVKRTHGVGWGSEVKVQSSASSTSAPVLSINTINDDLYVFWVGSPASNHIYYKKNVRGIWDLSPIDWIDENSSKLLDGTGSSCGRLTSFYKDYDRKIGLVYMTNPSSPYNIKFYYLPVDPIFNVVSETSTIIGILSMFGALIISYIRKKCPQHRK
jgi:hypothetical protein